jgi:hypothetical protein
MIKFSFPHPLSIKNAPELTGISIVTNANAWYQFDQQFTRNIFIY